MDQPEGWTWQDRAEGSIRRGTTLDPNVEPIDDIRAFPTAYLPTRLLITVDDDNGAYDQEVKTLHEAAGAFGWQLQLEEPAARSRLTAEVPWFVRARLLTPDEPGRGESPVPPDAWRVLQRARRISRSVMPRTSLEHVLSIDPVGLNPFTRT